ncbi:MAG: MFS transporter [Streptosporangiaceae bacterium]
MTVTAGDTDEPTEQPGRRRERRAWYVYDWANSAFATTVIAVFIGPYLTNVTQAAADPAGFVHPMGLPVRAGAFYPYVVSLSVLLQVVVLPFVGALADRTGRKKQLLAACAYVGAFATMGLYFLAGERYLLGGGLFLVANVALGASLVVYNSFLPEISSPEERDRTSARGWALGYLGGGVLLLANLVLFLRHDAFGLSEGTAVRVSLASAGAWWAVFTVVPMAGLRRRTSASTAEGGTVAASVRQLGRTLSELRGYPHTLLVLIAFLLYNDGIHTVIALASTYGSEALGLRQTVLIGAILMVQFVAFCGALLLGAVARVAGTKRVLLVSLVVWTVVVGAAYALRRGEAVQFFALAFVIGIVLGGSQALSRSLFSHLIPSGGEGRYFSLYEISDRGTSWFGTFVFGIALQWTGSYRVAIVSLVVFFVVGIALLAAADVRRGIREVGNPVPPTI